MVNMEMENKTHLFAPDSYKGDRPNVSAVMMCKQVARDMMRNKLFLNIELCLRLGAQLYAWTPLSLGKDRVCTHIVAIVIVVSG